MAWRERECDDEPVAATGGQAFRMVIEDIVTITGRPGLHLVGEIESGVVQVGDHLNLLDGGKLSGEVVCDGVDFLGRFADAQRCLVTVYASTLRPGEVHKGQVLAGTQLRRADEAALPRSISAPLARQQSAEAAAFANRYYKALLSLSDSVQPTADSDHEA